MKQEMNFWMRIAAALVAIVALTGLAINQWSSFIARGVGAQRIQRLEYYEEVKTKEAAEVKDAIDDCQAYDAEPVVIYGEMHCIRWATEGAGNIATLEWLKENVPLAP